MAPKRREQYNQRVVLLDTHKQPGESDGEYQVRRWLDQHDTSGYWFVEYDGAPHGRPLVYGRKYRADFAAPSIRMLIEWQGAVYQSNRAHTDDKHRHRMNLLQQHGWFVWQISTRMWGPEHIALLDAAIRQRDMEVRG